MKVRNLHLLQTDSTNNWLRQRRHEMEADLTVVTADFQTAGRGQGTNTWESEPGKNLLFSILLHPKEIPAHRQFHISMAVSVAISEVLEQYADSISIKWPNDIYWKDRKIGGILIEHTLQGQQIKDSIIGVGLNVNQQRFLSSAPNPVSLWKITGKETDRGRLLDDITLRFQQLLTEDVRSRYMQRLYRRDGLHCYRDAKGLFMARIADIKDDGRLVLTDKSGQQRTYLFKEVQFVLEPLTE